MVATQHREIDGRCGVEVPPRTHKNSQSGAKV